MLPDNDDAIHRERVTPLTERGRHGGIHRHVVLLRGHDTDVVGGDLHQVNCNDIAQRRLKMVIELFPFQEFSAVAKAVACRAVLRQDHREFRTRSRKRSLNHCLRARLSHCRKRERCDKASLHKLPPRSFFCH